MRRTPLSRLSDRQPEPRAAARSPYQRDTQSAALFPPLLPKPLDEPGRLATPIHAECSRAESLFPAVPLRLSFEPLPPLQKWLAPASRLFRGIQLQAGIHDDRA